MSTPLKLIEERLRDKSSDYILSVYVTLLQLRFMYSMYDIDLSEETLEQMLIKQVYSRLFQERAGQLYDSALQLISEVYKKFPEVRSAELRNRLVEEFEVHFHDYLMRTFPLYIKLHEVPHVWRQIILTTMEKVRRREYVVHDQTRAGTVALWEGELLKDVPDVHNLRLLERYLLVSNIALFGYNVYLVFPIYTVSSLAQAYLETHNVVDLMLRDQQVRDEDLMSLIERLCKIVLRQCEITRQEESVLITRKLTFGKLTVRIVPEDVLEHYRTSRDILVVLSKKGEVIEESNIITVPIMSDNVRTAISCVLAVRQIVGL